MAAQCRLHCGDHALLVEPAAEKRAQREPARHSQPGAGADRGADDIDAAVKAAKRAYKEWKRVPPLERAKMLKKIAEVLRNNAGELAMIAMPSVTAYAGDTPIEAASGSGSARYEIVTPW